MDKLEPGWRGVPHRRPTAESDTSARAAESIQKTVHNQRQRAWEFIRERGGFGATAQETNAALGIMHNCCSRFTELRQMGRIFRSGGTRPTSSGRQADVYLSVDPEAWFDKRPGWPCPRALSEVEKLRRRVKYLEGLLELNCINYA